MPENILRFAGAELYFDDLGPARRFYTQILKLKIADEQAGHYVKFESGSGFVCLERKGSESYPSRDKAVLFFEVADIRAAIASLGVENFVQIEKTWAVLHDPEGHNVLLLEKR